MRRLLSSFSLALCLLFSLSFAFRIATIFASRLLQLPIYFYLALPISLNSLDREGARLLSPCGSQITSKPDAGPDDSVPDDALELKWEFDEDSRRYYVSFPDDQYWCLVGAIGTVSHVRFIFYFGAVVGP